MKLFKNNSGATAVEFALVAVPVFVFILGIIQVGYVVWVDNLLQYPCPGRAGSLNVLVAGLARQ
jgi:Flp pilus assembly pilin Flp